MEQKAFSGIGSGDYKSALDAYLGMLPLLKDDDPRYQKARKKIVQLDDMIKLNGKACNMNKSESVK